MSTLSRIMIVAPRKSSGKTLFSVGMAAALTRRGLAVHPFKKGPDFIDPMWLAAACGRPCHNLDFFIMGREALQRNFQQYGAGADLCLVEGNMGFFDGQDLEGGDCGAALAAELELPVVLLVNAQGMGRSTAALVLGYLNFPGGERIRGVILNNVASPRHERRLREALVRYCPAPVLGVLPRTTTLAVDERHLGLVPVGERDELAGRIDRIADFVEQHVELEQLLALARAAPPLPEAPPSSPARVTTTRLRVGYAADRAFSFYYPENLAALSAAGAELIPFSLLGDAALPKVDGLFIGGGFPEVFMEQLDANRGLLAEVGRAARAGMPIYAECGGLMVLADALRWGERRLPMAGALPVEVTMEERPQGFGYMVLEGSGATPWPPPGRQVSAHEFHHSRVSQWGEGVTCAYRVVRGVGLGEGRDGALYRRVLASYAHFHADGDPDWVPFVLDFLSGQ